MCEVCQLNLGVEAKHAGERLVVISPHRDVHARFDILQVWHVYGIPLEASQTQGVRVLPGLEAKRNQAHTNQVATVNALKTLRNHSFDTLRGA
jgi:hypothetical protein